MPTYERKMELTFYGEDLLQGNKQDRKTQSDLHEKGIHLVSAYFWGNIPSLPESEKYGFQKVEDKDTSFEITIDDVQAFIVEYSHQAEDIVNQMIDNGYEADFSSIVKITSKSKWMPVNGRRMCFTAEEIEGESTHAGAYPHIVYVNGVRLDIQLTLSSVPSLVFTISYKADTIKDRKKIEQMIVDTPANDMRFIKNSVLQVLNKYSNSDIEINVDCSTKILSEANYDCSPETVKLIMGGQEVEQ